MLEHNLHDPVALVILPLFAFANAGLSLGGIAIALGVARLPKAINWWQLFGVSFACGIGFTMSLFIAGLAFEHGSGDYFAADRLGILIGSLASGIAAFVLLSLFFTKDGSG